jgi:hypothetical protein
MDMRVFAVDFFDDALWDNFVAKLNGVDIFNELFTCSKFKPYCEKVRIYLFSQRQWRILLDNITKDQGDKLEKSLNNKNLNRPSIWWVGSSQIKILCLSSNGDDLDVCDVAYQLTNYKTIGHQGAGHTAGKDKYITDKNDFNVNNPVPGQTLKDLIVKHLRTKIFTKERNLNSKDKNYWLHYLSKTQINIPASYNATEIVHCLDINCNRVQNFV